MKKPENNTINYIEFKAKDLNAIKTFYGNVFNWKFTDYGDNYISFFEEGIAGGFEKTKEAIVNGALTVIFHDDLLKAKQNITEAGGKIVKDIFSFPGGSRFQFVDPSGNELAVWTYEDEA